MQATAAEQPAVSAVVFRRFRQRVELRIPRQVLADRIGVHVTYLWRWEQGKVAPTPEHAARWDDALRELAAELADALTRFWEAQEIDTGTAAQVEAQAQGGEVQP